MCVTLSDYTLCIWMLKAPSGEKILYRLGYKAQSPINTLLDKHWETQQKIMWQCSTPDSGDLAQNAGPMLMISVQMPVILQKFNQYIYSK